MFSMSRLNRTVSNNLAFLAQYVQLIEEEDFSCFIDCSPEEFAAHLEGEPIGLDHLAQIHRYFGLSYEKLLHDDLSQLSPQEFTDLLASNPTNRKKGHAVSDGISIPLIPQKAGASYSERQRADYHLAAEFPTLRFPESILIGKATKRLRAFEVEGFSMTPEVQPGDIVIGEKQDNIYDILDGDRYVLVLKDGIVLKRVYLLSDESIFQAFRLYSDNPEYDPVDIKGEEVLEIWKTCFFLGAK